jgi:predicted lysophospholipase L1 biosynthesis ABC-type transport system permease subunit
LRHKCGYKRGRRAKSEYSVQSRERRSARIGQQPPEIAAKLEEAQAAKKVAPMAVFTQTLWSQQQQSIYQQESIYLREMGATDNLIQQATAPAMVSVEFEVFGHVQGLIHSFLAKFCVILCDGWHRKLKFLNDLR